FLIRQLLTREALCLSHSRDLTSMAGGKIKRFYKQAHVTKSGPGAYEVNLDQRRLRTPGGQPFVVPHEGLALAVVQEWNSQVNHIDRTRMHLTSLCNSAIDNPLGLSRDQQAAAILEYLETDTLLFWSTEPEDLHQLQRQRWQPVLDNVNQQYSLRLAPTLTLQPPQIDGEALKKFRARLASLNSWGVSGVRFAAESLKSCLLAVCLLDRRLPVSEACSLSRLESQFQADKWGQVEWHHGVDATELECRVSAGTLMALVSHEWREVQLAGAAATAASRQGK
ncbi:hypothetical protein BOX15_Mlig007483g1, partial [Macrostomum lignano]